MAIRQWSIWGADAGVFLYRLRFAGERSLVDAQRRSLDQAGICSDEIPKGERASLYANMANGKSTFVPAPCPTGGCKP